MWLDNMHNLTWQLLRSHDWLPFTRRLSGASTIIVNNNDNFINSSYFACFTDEYIWNCFHYKYCYVKEMSQLKSFFFYSMFDAVESIHRVFSEFCCSNALFISLIYWFVYIGRFSSARYVVLYNLRLYTVVGYFIAWVLCCRNTLFIIKGNKETCVIWFSSSQYTHSQFYYPHFSTWNIWSVKQCHLYLPLQIRFLYHYGLYKNTTHVREIANMFTLRLSIFFWRA